MTTDSSQSRQRFGSRLPAWALGLLILIVVTFLVGSSIWLFRSVRAEVSRWEVTDPDFSNVVDSSGSTAVTPGAPSVNVIEPASPQLSGDTLKAWDGKERISFLLLGIDKRCDEEGPTHTDTMMVATLDPVSKSAAILSLPRDLWVDIPGFGMDRVNQAYYLGQVYEYPGGGQALARETIEATVGVEVDHYVAVDFEAFTEMIDLIGGIEVDVSQPIDDPTYPDSCYGYDPFQIEAGVQQMDGETALKYARTRATFGGDVDRAGRQQAVIMAARDQVVQLDMVPKLIRQAPQIWQTLQDNVRTNFSLEEMVQLALLAQEIPAENIRTAVINYDYVYNETTPDGRQVLVPRREEIRALRDELFAPPPVPTPSIAQLPTLTAEEEARVAIYNGTSIFGLAADTRDYLQEKGVNVVEIGNADTATYRTTQVINYGEYPNTALYLVQVMDIPPLNISSGQQPEGDFDILVILGNDWRVPDG